MKVKRNSWHYKRYERWERWKIQTKATYQPRKTLDLCHYMRVILFWYSLRWPFQRKLFGNRLRPIGVLLILIWLGLIGFLLYGLTNVSNWDRVLVVIGLSLASVVLLTVVVFGLAYLFGEKKLHVTIRESDTFQLTKTYVKAKKSRVCPIIKVEE